MSNELHSDLEKQAPGIMEAKEKLAQEVKAIFGQAAVGVGKHDGKLCLVVLFEEKATGEQRRKLNEFSESLGFYVRLTDDTGPVIAQRQRM